MAHFAKLNQENIVISVIKVNNNELLDNGIESEEKGMQLIAFLEPGSPCVVCYWSSPLYFYFIVTDCYTPLILTLLVLIYIS